MTVQWTIRADGDQGAQFAPRPSPVLSTMAWSRKTPSLNFNYSAW